MNTKTLFLASVAISALLSCGNKTNQETEGQDSLTAEDFIPNDSDAPGLINDSTFIGIIDGVGTTTHSIVLISTGEDPDTVAFNVDDETDQTNCHAILEGSPCQIVFKGDINDDPVATYIETPKTYDDAIGRWTAEDPMSGKPICIELNVCGEIKVKGLKDLRAVSWKIANDDLGEITIVTKGYEGEDVDVKATIAKDGKTLALENDNNVYVKN
ncbi:MAG: hypothetical protein HUK08_03190 [Bacteroidaceae bacterium]|nr:hypothetical protein [Bacteroidaceae bacterium]